MVAILFLLTVESARGAISIEICLNEILSLENEHEDLIPNVFIPLLHIQSKWNNLFQRNTKSY